MALSFMSGLTLFFFEVGFTVSQGNKFINLCFGEGNECLLFCTTLQHALQYRFYLTKSVMEYKGNINLLIEMEQILVLRQFP